MFKLRFYIKIIILCYFTLFSACNKDENTPAPSSQAKFIVEISNNGIIPSTVKFINQSVNATNYVWKFGTGDSLVTDTKDDVSFTYTQSGSYLTSLTIKPKNPNLYYNVITYEKNIVISDVPVKRLYFTDRSATENKVKYIALNNSIPPVIEEFESASLNKPYGMHMDTLNDKLYVTDYAEQVLNRYDWNGASQEVLMNSNTSNFDSPIGIMVIENKIYWGEKNGVNYANLDGSNPKVFLSMPGEYPQDLAYDYINQQIYFTNNMDTESGGVWKVDINGSNLMEIIPDVWGAAIEIDPENNRLYFYVAYEGMYLSNLDGSNKILFDSSNAGKWTWGMAIDKDAEKIYYPNRVESTIRRANLDGSNVEIFVPASANINPNAMTIDTYR